MLELLDEENDLDYYTDYDFDYQTYVLTGKKCYKHKSLLEE